MKKIIFLIASSLLFFVQPTVAQQKMVFSTINGLTITATGERLLKEAYQQLNIAISVEALPGERSLLNASSGKTDGELGRIAGLEKEYPNLMMVPVPLIELSESAFSIKNITIHDFSDLKKYRVGYVVGSKISEKMTVGVPHRLPVNKPEQLFDMLLHDRIDIALHTTEDGLMMLESDKYAGIKETGPPLLTVPMYHYLNKKHANVVPAISKVLQDMVDKGVFKKEKDAFYAKLKK